MNISIAVERTFGDHLRTHPTRPPYLFNLAVQFVTRVSGWLTLITLHVHRTGKAAPGRVVFASYENTPPHFGVELDNPANIWGLIDAPEDWQEVLNQS